MPALAPTTDSRAVVLSLVESLAPVVSDDLSSSGRSYLSSLIRGLPSNAPRALSAARVAGARDAAALAAAAAAAAEDVPAARRVELADIAMCFGGAAVATALQGLVGDAEGEDGVCGDGGFGEKLFWGEVGEGAAWGSGVEECNAAALGVDGFRQRFWEAEKVVKIRRMAQVEAWGALGRWSKPSELCWVLGHRTVPVEVGGEEKFVLFRQVLEGLVEGGSGEGSDKVYLAQHPLLDYVAGMRSDVSVPKYARVGGAEDENVLVNVWIGGAGTGTTLHFDTADNLLTQIVGVKRVTLFYGTETKYLYVEKGNNFSPVDVDKPDVERFPLLRDATSISCELHPGDSLYIPAGCWHWVRAMTSSISVNHWF